MKKQVVVLEVTTPDQYPSPASWDWTDAANFDDEDNRSSVTVIAFGGVEPVEEQDDEALQNALATIAGALGGGVDLSKFIGPMRFGRQ